MFFRIYDIDSLCFKCCKWQIFEFRCEVITWAQTIGKQYGIIVVTVNFDISNGKRDSKDKLIMSFEIWGDYIRKNVSESNNSSEDIYSMKVKCPFRPRSVASGSGWKVMVRCTLY